MGLDLDWARYIDATHDEPGRWALLASPRPVTVNFWYRTSPRLLIPIGRENNVVGLNPPLTVSGMTLAVARSRRTADGVPRGPRTGGDRNRRRARSDELDHAVRGRRTVDGGVHAGRAALGSVGLFADERKAWEGRLPERPEVPIRVEAAALCRQTRLLHGDRILGSHRRAGRRPRCRASPRGSRRSPAS